MALAWRHRRPERLLIVTLPSPKCNYLPQGNRRSLLSSHVPVAEDWDHLESGSSSRFSGARRRAVLARFGNGEGRAAGRQQVRGMDSSRPCNLRVVWVTGPQPRRSVSARLSKPARSDRITDVYFIRPAPFLSASASPAISIRTACSTPPTTSFGAKDSVPHIARPITMCGVHTSVERRPAARALVQILLFLNRQLLC
jgi:hypothetical protein